MKILQIKYPYMALMVACMVIASAGSSYAQTKECLKLEIGLDSASHQAQTCYQACISEGNNGPTCQSECAPNGVVYDSLLKEHRAADCGYYQPPKVTPLLLAL